MSENMGTSLNQSTGTENTGSVQTSTESTQTSTNEGVNDEAFLDGLFGDTNENNSKSIEENGDEETTEESEEANTETEENNDGQEETTEEKDNQQETPFLKIKYNGEEENLTMEQAIELAQKGKNYDKKAKQYEDLLAQNEKLNQAINSKPMQVINQVAKELGLSANQFADYLLQYNEKQKYSQVFNSLKQQYPDADDAVINKLASAQLDNNYLKRQNLEAQNLGKTQLEAKVKVENELKEFHDKYPDVTDKDLTDDVLEDIKSGMNVTLAYEKHLHAVTQAKNSDLQKQVEDLKKQLEATKANIKVKQKSTGSLKGNGNNTASDTFLEGLFG